MVVKLFIHLYIDSARPSKIHSQFCGHVVRILDFRVEGLGFDISQVVEIVSLVV